MLIDDIRPFQIHGAVWNTRLNIRRTQLPGDCVYVVMKKNPMTAHELFMAFYSRNLKWL